MDYAAALKYAPSPQLTLEVSMNAAIPSACSRPLETGLLIPPRFAAVSKGSFGLLFGGALVCQAPMHYFFQHFRGEMDLYFKYSLLRRSDIRSKVAVTWTHMPMYSDTNPR